MTTTSKIMKSERRIQKKIWVFLFLTFAFSAIAYYEMISTGTARKVGGFWMFSSGIAAILTKLIFRENLQEFGWQLGERKCLLLGLGIPFLYALSIYSFVWLTGLGEITFPSFSHLLIFLFLQ